MAGALWKKEVVIRQNSTISVAGAQDWTKNWLDRFQDDEDNIDEDGDYIDYFFADLFDSRTGNLYRIFTDAAGTRFKMTDTVFEILNTARYVETRKVSDNPDLSTDQDFLITRGGLKDVLGQFIARARVVNDAGVVSDNKITLAHTPSGGIIGGTCRVKIADSNVFDEVECSVDGNVLTIIADDGDNYEGNVCLVSYLVR
jgi:hypothetical protein